MRELKCKRKGCPKSDVTVLEENEKFVTTLCRSCGLYHVMTRTREKLRARYELRQGAKERMRQHKPKKLIFS